jgi:hypothetical protein
MSRRSSAREVEEFYFSSGSGSSLLDQHKLAGERRDILIFL